MKANLFLTFISVMLAALLGYLAFNVANGEDNDVICGIGSCICFAVTLIPTMGLQYESKIEREYPSVFVNILCAFCNQPFLLRWIWCKNAILYYCEWHYADDIPCYLL